MIHKIAKRSKFVYAVVDVIIISACLFIPYILRHNQITLDKFLHLGEFVLQMNLPGFKDYFLIFMLWSVFTIIALNLNALYATDRELTIPKEFLRVVKSIFYSTIPIVTMVVLLKIEYFSRYVLVNAFILMVCALGLFRLVKRIIVRHLIVSGYNNFNILIIGAGRVGKILADEIHLRPYLGLRLCGYLDDAKNKGEEINGTEVLGKISDFETVVRRKFIDDVYVTIPSQRKIVSDLVLKGKSIGVGVKIVPDLYDIVLGELRTHQLGFLPLLEYQTKGIHGTDLFIKRSMDILCALLLLIFLLPVCVFIAGLIKLDSAGPVFYVSTRCGRKGRPFKFYKFRSMQNEAEKQKTILEMHNEKDGPIFKIRNDPRITKIGRFIRRYSLDELPQLWNVLIGDMSLVGPRPPTQDEVKKYTDLQLRRLEIRPGITCLWQVRGRSELSFSKWVELDIWYIDHWSLWLDIRILFWTIPAVVKAEGAY